MTRPTAGFERKDRRRVNVSPIAMSQSVERNVKASDAVQTVHLRAIEMIAGSWGDLISNAAFTSVNGTARYQSGPVLLRDARFHEISLNG